MRKSWQCLEASEWAAIQFKKRTEEKPSWCEMTWRGGGNKAITLPELNRTAVLPLCLLQETALTGVLQGKRSDLLQGTQRTLKYNCPQCSSFFNYLLLSEWKRALNSGRWTFSPWVGSWGFRLWELKEMNHSHLCISHNRDRKHMLNQHWPSLTSMGPIILPLSEWFS